MLLAPEVVAQEQNPPDHERCIADFSKLYFDRYAPDPDKVRKAYGRRYFGWDADPVRFLLPEGFVAPKTLVDCAANGGDQLALFARAVDRLSQDETSAENVALALRDLSAAAQNKPAVEHACSVKIYDQRFYECPEGLPEAHALLADFFLSCGLQFNAPAGIAHAEAAAKGRASIAERVLVRSLIVREPKFFCNRSEGLNLPSVDLEN